jgi:hypothetical protein
MHNYTGRLTFTMERLFKNPVMGEEKLTKVYHKK